MTTALLSPPAITDATASTVARLREVAEGRSGGRLEWHHPGPSAAFTRRDSRETGFAEAVDEARGRGFAPFIRPVGGRLAAYHDGALVLDLLARCEEPRAGVEERFRSVASALAHGMRQLGVDAHVGGLPGEYCPGEWSVHAAGRHKLVGTGQRLVRGALLFTAVIVVGDPEPLADVMVAAYGRLGVPMDPATIGSVAQHAPGVSLGDVRDALGEALARVLPLGGPNLVDGRAFHGAWDLR